jgi:hypothetical protein
MASCAPKSLSSASSVDIGSARHLKIIACLRELEILDVADL